MKLFDKDLEKIAWTGLLLALPTSLFALWMSRGRLGKIELLAVFIAFIVGCLLLLLIKWFNR